MPICPKYSVSGVTVSIRIDSLQGERVGEDTPAEELFFDINAKLDERKKTNAQVALSFNLSITSKPNVAKYAITGMVTLEGSMKDINKRLEINPKTQVPQILFTVYQHVFNSIYLLSSVLNTPYPPPDLLHPMQEKIQILPKGAENEAAQPQHEKKTESPQVLKETGKPETATEELELQTEKRETSAEAKTSEDTEEKK